jgi:hypothetical protein
VRIRRGFRRFAIVAFAILLPIAAWSLWDYIEGVRLARAIQAIHAKGDPVSEYEITRFHVPATEEQQRASRYYLAAAVLASGSSIYRKMPSEALGRFAEALAMLDRATPLDFRGFSPGSEFSYRVSNLMELERLNSLRTESLARDGHGDGAAASLVASLRLRRTLAESWWWADRNAPADLGGILNHSRASDAALRLMQNAYDAAMNPTAVEDRIIRMRGRMIEFFWREYFGSTPVTPVRGASPRLPLRERLRRPLLAHRFVSGLETAERLLEAARQPWPRKLDAVDKPSAPAPMQGRADRSFWWFMRPFQFSIEPGFVDAGTRLASDRVALAALAIERFRRPHGGVSPTSLADLVPQYLQSIPDDPFSGKPLVYRRDDDGYIVYSVGSNRADDGGKIGDTALDIGLRISASER